MNKNLIGNVYRFLDVSKRPMYGVVVSVRKKEDYVDLELAILQLKFSNIIPRFDGTVVTIDDKKSYMTTRTQFVEVSRLLDGVDSPIGKVDSLSIDNWIERKKRTYTQHVKSIYSKLKMFLKNGFRLY